VPVLERSVVPVQDMCCCLEDEGSTPSAQNTTNAFYLEYFNSVYMFTARSSNILLILVA
jgi:hypothetical protein